MAKFKPGIPDSFSLNVEPVRDLGDYLDEPAPKPVLPRKSREESPPEPAAAPVPEAIAAPAVDAPTPPPNTVTVQTTTPPPSRPAAHVATPGPAAHAGPAARNDDVREERGGKPKAPRREVSMSPETLRMTDELLEIIRSGSGQRDTYANELIHALVLLAYEAKGGLDPHSIPRRGRWGTPTARAYPLELKNAFLKALLERHSAASEDAVRGRFPVNDAA